METRTPADIARDTRDTLRRRIATGITTEDDALALDHLCATEYHNGHARGTDYGRLGFLHAHTCALYTVGAFAAGFALATVLTFSLA